MRSLLLGLILSTTITGCSKQNDASATTEVGSSAKGTSAETAGSGISQADRRAADDKATEDLQAARAGEANTVAAKAATDADAVAAHEVVQDQLQVNFDAADRRLNAMKEKVTKTPNKAATAALGVAQTHGATVMASIAKLRTANLAGWDAAKAQVDTDYAQFTKSVDALEVSMP